MCEPLTIASIALTAGGIAANQIAQSKVQSARNDVLAAERIRQKGLDAEAAALNTQSQDRYQNAEAQQEAKSKELGDYFKQQQIENQTAANDGTKAQIAALPTSGSNITVQAEKDARGEARDFTNRQGEARGDLRSFGDFLGGVGRLQARDASKIGQLGGFKKASSDITALELDAANGAGNGIKMFGDLAGALGQAGIAKSLQGSWVGSTPTVAKTAAAASAPATSNGLYNLFGIFG